VNSAVLLADAGNIGLIICAAIDTTATLAYGWKARGGEHGAWWRSPVGLHLMAFMAAFAVVLDMNSVYLLTSHQVLLPVAPFRPDWFAWVRGLAFLLLIPPVLAWRLALILRPPRLPSPYSTKPPGFRPGGFSHAQRDDAEVARCRSSMADLT
jgi:hypothetical protein